MLTHHLKLHVCHAVLLEGLCEVLLRARAAKPRVRCAQGVVNCMLGCRAMLLEVQLSCS